MIEVKVGLLDQENQAKTVTVLAENRFLENGSILPGNKIFEHERKPVSRKPILYICTLVYL